VRKSMPVLRAHERSLCNHQAAGHCKQIVMIGLIFSELVFLTCRCAGLRLNPRSS
jgi:hypothetical protein